MGNTVFTKIGKRTELPYMIAYDAGVYEYPFQGIFSVVDPADNLVWTWGIDAEITEVLALFQSLTMLTVATTYNDCVLIDGSFYWDDTNNILYAHWFGLVNDYTIDRSLSILQQVAAGYSSKYHAASKNVFDGIYYPPIIQSMSTLDRKADSNNFGMILFNDASFSINDTKNSHYDIELRDAVGLQLWVYSVPDGATALTNAMRIFTGSLNGIKHNREELEYSIIENRFFDDVPVCQNYLTISEFANCGDNENKLKPVAWGDIRRSKMILTNKDALTEVDSGTAIFLVADPAIGSVLQISNVYDSSDTVAVVTATDLTNCLVSVTKPAGVDPSDLEKWSWEGQGYNITGTYNNALNIIKHIFEIYCKVPYTSSTYDQTQWAAQTALKTAAVGISIQSTNGIMTECIEKICASVYGNIILLGDNRISFISRNLKGNIKENIYSYNQKDIPEINIDPKNTISELVLRYSPNYMNDEIYKQYIYVDEKYNVQQNYGINRRTPISPFETVLVNKADVENLAAEMMQIYKKPEKEITIDAIGLWDLLPYDIIYCDIGLYNIKDMVYLEVSDSKPDIINDKQSITAKALFDRYLLIDNNNNLIVDENMNAIMTFM